MAAPVIASRSSDKTGNTSDGIVFVYSTDGPSGIVAGELLVAEVSAARAGSPGTVPDIPTPAGWDLWVTGEGVVASAQRNTRVSFFRRIAQAGDTGVTFTATPADTGFGMTAKVSRITGADTAAPDAGNAAATGVSGTAISAPSVTTPEADCLILCGVGSCTSAVAAWTKPGALTEECNFGTDPGEANNLACGSKVQATAGATGAQEFTSAATGSLAAVTIAIAPTTDVTGQVGLATNPHTAQAFGKQKVRSFGQPEETDLSQAMAVQRRKAFLQALESDEAVSIVFERVLSQILETDAALAFRVQKLRTLLQAEETSLAQLFSRARLQSVGLANETDVAFLIDEVLRRMNYINRLDIILTVPELPEIIIGDV